MRHINLTQEGSDGLASFMVTQESDSFGTQILSLKRLNEGRSAYETLSYTSRDEGDWMSLSEMKNWMKEVVGGEK